MEATEKLENWLNEEAAVRERLAPVGIAAREDLRGNTGLAFLQKVCDGGLPRAPVGNLMGFHTDQGGERPHRVPGYARCTA